MGLRRLRKSGAPLLAMAMATAAACGSGGAGDGDGGGADAGDDAGDPGDGDASWHTIYGGAGIDYGDGVAVGPAGEVYVVGMSEGTWSGPGGEAPIHQHTGDGAADLFVLKLGADGRYLWHTFLGGEALDYAAAACVDGEGRLVVGGSSYSAWDGPSGEAPLHPHDPALGLDAVVASLDPDGGFLWHTFYGSTHAENLEDIACGPDGPVGVGYGDATWDGPGAAAPLAPFHTVEGELWTDAFALALGEDGGYLWHTFYGSYDNDAALAVALDAEGNAVLTGAAGAPFDGPAGEAPSAAFPGGLSAAYVVRLDAAGAYRGHAFFGGEWGEVAGWAIACDAAGNAVIAGSSAGPAWLGPAGEAPVAEIAAPEDSVDVVVLAVAADGTFGWHGFFGNAAWLDKAHGVALTEGGGVLVAGESTASWDGPAGAAPLNPHSGDPYTVAYPGDVVLLALDGDGAYSWHAFYGSAGAEDGRGLALAPGGRAVVSGSCDTAFDGPWGAPLHGDEPAVCDALALSLELPAP